MRDFFTQMVSLDVGAGRETLRRGGVKYYGHLTLPPGEYLVRVLARDAASGRGGVRAVPVEVPDLASASSLLTPFFFDAPGQGRGNRMFRAHRYGPDHPALAGRQPNSAACAWLNRSVGLG